MKIAITFWGTGTYLNLLPEWYERLEDNFLPDIEKQYVVFTDGELEGVPDNINRIEIPDYGFPETFHKTFEEILKIEDRLKDFDWLVSVDADLYVQERIEYGEFFDESKKYFGVHHPCHRVGFPPHNQHPGAYDRNSRSNAYIDDTIIDMEIYYQGCLWGGKIPHVFDMMREIDKWTQEDVLRESVGQYYEESYLNKWFLTHRNEVHTLAADYAYPQMFAQYCDFPNKMMHLAKDNRSLGNNEW